MGLAKLAIKWLNAKLALLGIEGESRLHMVSPSRHILSVPSVLRPGLVFQWPSFILLLVYSKGKNVEE